MNYLENLFCRNCKKSIAKTKRFVNLEGFTVIKVSKVLDHIASSF